MNEGIQITILGMGLVFAVIVLLVGLMGLLVRLTADRPAPAAAPAAAAVVAPAAPDASRPRRRKAAAAAVAVALARSRAGSAAMAPQASVSPWQAVMRGAVLRRRPR